MDTDTLVNDIIDAGRKLVEELPKRGFSVTAAFWLKTSDDGKWHFYLVSPVVDAKGLPMAYRELHPLVRTMPQPFGIDPLEIKLIGPKNALARDVLTTNRQAAAHGTTPLRWSGKQAGNVCIEDAFVYLPA
jgi:hypothetical protein